MTPNVRRVKRKWLGVGALLLVLGACLFWLFRPPAFHADPDLIRTAREEPSSNPAGVGVIHRVMWKYDQFKTKLHPNAFRWTFPASPQARSCDIRGFLNRCMDVSGTQYLIEKKVAPGTVMFGHTNVLNGQLWVQAFEHALQNNSPKWYDSGDRAFHSENLVLLRYNKRTVLVLTPATAQKYREKYPKLTPLER